MGVSNVVSALELERLGVTNLGLLKKTPKREPPSSSPGKGGPSPAATARAFAEKARAKSRASLVAAQEAQEMKRKKSATPQLDGQDSPMSELSKAGDSDDELPDISMSFAGVEADIAKAHARVDADKLQTEREQEAKEKMAKEAREKEERKDLGIEGSPSPKKTEKRNTNLPKRKGKKAYLNESGPREGVRKSARGSTTETVAVAKKEVRKETRTMGESGPYTFERLKQERLAHQRAGRKSDANADRLAEILAEPDMDQDITPPASPRGLAELQATDLSQSPSKRLYKRSSDLHAAMADIQQSNMLNDHAEARREAIAVVKAEFSQNETYEEHEARVRAMNFRRVWLDEQPPARALDLDPCPASASEDLQELHARLNVVVSEGPMADLRIPSHELPTAISWLFKIVQNGVLSEVAALSVMPFLTSLLQQLASSTADKLVYPLTYVVVHEALRDLGLRERKVEKGKGRDSSSVPVVVVSSSSAKERLLSLANKHRAARRILKVIQELARLHLIAPRELPDFLVLVMRIRLDPEDIAATENYACSTIHQLCVQAEESQDTQVLRDLLSGLVSAFGADAATTLELRRHVVLSLPHYTKTQRTFRRWLAFGFLVDMSLVMSREAENIDMTKRPFYDDVASLVDGGKRDSPFCTRRGHMKDASVIHAAALLRLITSDQYEELHPAEGAEKEKKAASELTAEIKELIKQLGKLESTITSNILADPPERLQAKMGVSSLRQTLNAQIPQQGVQQRRVDDYFGDLLK